MQEQPSRDLLTAEKAHPTPSECEGSGCPQKPRGNALVSHSWCNKASPPGWLSNDINLFSQGSGGWMS